MVTDSTLELCSLFLSWKKFIINTQNRIKYFTIHFLYGY